VCTEGVARPVVSSPVLAPVVICTVFRLDDDESQDKRV